MRPSPTPFPHLLSQSEKGLQEEDVGHYKKEGTWGLLHLADGQFEGWGTQRVSRGCPGMNEE